MEQKEHFNNSRFKNISKNNPFPYNYREWIPDIKTSEIQSVLPNPNRLIRVINYNVLADSLLPISTKIKESEIDSKLPHLKWENRAQKIFEELKELNGDILCIEEIERDESFIAKLISIGYEFSFKPRTGNHSEGCALAWKKEKFDLIDLIGIEYNMNKTNKDISPIYDRDNIGLFGVFSIKGDNDSVIINAVTHLVFNKGRGDIKLAQIYQLVNSMEILKKKYESQNKKVYLIIGTDANAAPKSGVYKLLTTGKLNCTYVDKYKLSGQDPDNLQYADPKRLRSYLLKSITTKYKGDVQRNDENDKSKQAQRLIDNVKWYNEVCRVEPVLTESPSTITLTYNSKYRARDYGIILNLPITFKSAYSSICDSIIHYIDEQKEQKTLPFRLIKSVQEVDNIEVNGIKMGVAEIKKTLTFISGLTLDVPLTSYNNNTLMASDFIFFSGDNMKVVRILNIPDINKIVFDIGFMPNTEFPSDHLSLGADFVIGEEL